VFTSPVSPERTGRQRSRPLSTAPMAAATDLQ
jgi:hypothetical protein